MVVGNGGGGGGGWCALSRSSSLCQRLVGLEGTRTYGLRLVYLRTKCFLFGPRATCASHGGFVAAFSPREREKETATGPTRAKPRHAFEEKRVSFPLPSSFLFPSLSSSIPILHLSQPFLPPSLSLSLNVLRVTFACVHA